MNQIVKLEKNDDITAIRSRLEFLLPALTQQTLQQADNKRRKARLLVVVPRGNKALHNLVNMKLLARTVKSRAVELAIVSSSPTIRDNARAAGVKAFGAVWHAKLTRWIKPQAAVVKPEETDSPAAVPPVAEETGSKRQTRKKSERRRVKQKKFEVVSGGGRAGFFGLVFRQLGLLVVIFVLAVALVVGVIALLPEATVTLTPVSRPVETDLIVKADPNVTSVDFETLTFPARIDQVELELFGEIETIKTELAPTGLARGAIVFINRTEDEQTIPVSTTVSTSAGNPVEFLTVQTATIPGGIGATTSTVVVAVEPGPSGNVPAGQINRFGEPAFDRLARVVNEQPTGGGTLEPAKIVEQDDKPRLDAHLRQMVQQEGLKQLQDSLGEQEFIPPESVQVIVLEVDYQEFSGDFSDTFGGEMQAVVRATVIGGYNANRLALAGLNAQVPATYELDLEGLNFGAGEILDITDSVVTFRVFANGRALPVIDANHVVRDIAWLPIGEAQALLSEQYQLATVPGVELNPAWLTNLIGRLPFVPLRINVVINDTVTQLAEGS